MANVAQLVEPRFVVPVVVGSSPIVRPSLRKGISSEMPFSVTLVNIGFYFKQTFQKLFVKE